MFNERKIRIFLRVAQFRSFSEAARQLYMTQQAVSKSVAELEADVGRTLFIRRYRTLELTEDGKHLRRILINFMRAYDDFTDNEHSPARQEILLRVGYPVFSACGSLYSGAFVRLRQAHPNVRVEIQCLKPEGLIELLNLGALDIIFLRDAFFPENMKFEMTSINSETMYLLVSAQDERVGRGANVSSFLRDPYVTTLLDGETEAQARLRAIQQCAGLGLSPTEIVVAPDEESAVYYVELGSGVKVTSSGCLLLQSRGVKCYPMGRFEQNICAYWDGDYTPLVKECIGYIQDAMSVSN